MARLTTQLATITARSARRGVHQRDRTGVGASRRAVQRGPGLVTRVRGVPLASEALGVVNREWVLFSLVLCDPHGFRPLVIGDALAVWSETCALDLIDTNYVLKSEPMVRMWGPYPIFG